MINNIFRKKKINKIIIKGKSFKTLLFQHLKVKSQTNILLLINMKIKIVKINKIYLFHLNIIKIIKSNNLMILVLNRRKEIIQIKS